MQLSDKIKKFSVEQAIDYRNKNRSRTCRSSSTGRTRSAPDSKAPPPDWETVLLHAFHFHGALPAACAGAVTSVRVTPLEKVRLLRMVEKSLDMLR